MSVNAVAGDVTEWEMVTVSAKNNLFGSGSIAPKADIEKL
jgi:hypothetical protein